MNYKTLKLLSIIVGILLVLSCSLTVVGFSKHTKNKNNVTTENNTTINDDDNTKEGITFKYFLEDVEVNEIPQNEKVFNKKTKQDEINILYKFDSYKCTNNIKGEFDDVEWKFTVTSGTRGECELRFYKSKYNVDLTVIQGVEGKDNPKTIDRFRDGEFIVKPNPGFEYLESKCSNDKIASYDSSKNIFKISSINNDISCKITFTQKKLKVELTVKNGTSEGANASGVSKIDAFYEDKVTQIVKPSQGYEFVKTTTTKKKKSKTKVTVDHLTCTNNQKATFKNNEFIIEKLTDNTRCTLEFTKMNVVKYKIKITNSESFNNIFEISKGSDEIDVEEGSTGEIKIAALGDDIPKLVKCTELPTRKGPIKGEYTFTWLNVSKNISCTLAKE